MKGANHQGSESTYSRPGQCPPTTCSSSELIVSLGMPHEECDGDECKKRREEQSEHYLSGNTRPQQPIPAKLRQPMCAVRAPGSGSARVVVSYLRHRPPPHGCP